MKLFLQNRTYLLKRRSLSPIPILFIIFFSSLFTACTGLTDAEQVDLLNRLLEPDSAAFSAALGQIEDADDRAFIAPLIDLVWADQIGVIEGDRSAEILLA